MNVPFPAPCHVCVAGVGKQSVWGLRIIAELNYYCAILLKHRQQQKVAGRPRNRTRISHSTTHKTRIVRGGELRDCAFGRRCVDSVIPPAHWNSRRESNPDLL